MTADEEDQYIIAQASEPLNEDNTFANERVTVRRRDETIEVDRNDVDYVDVSPRQLISVATGMIPFLENDDANRALMGSNMQRQARAAAVSRGSHRRHRHRIQGRVRFRRGASGQARTA